MPIGYVTKPGCNVRVRSKTALISSDGDIIASWEILHLQALLLVGGVNITTPAIRRLARQDVPVGLLSHTGGITAWVTGPRSGRVDVRIGQHRLLDDPASRLFFARRVVAAKINAMRREIERNLSNHPDSTTPVAMSALQTAGLVAAEAMSIESLLGVEGAAARQYFRACAAFNRSAFPLTERSRRPPRDPINAMLSFGYTLLTNETRVVLESLGADPFVGGYHSWKNNRPALSLDLIEPFRHAVIDRAVFLSCNRGSFQPKDFITTPDRGCRLIPDARKRFLARYEDAMLETPRPSDVPAELSKSHNWRQALAMRCEHVTKFFASLAKVNPKAHRVNSQATPERSAA